MLLEATAIRFMGLLGTGRNRPALVASVEVNGSTVELVIKPSGSELGLSGLVAEGLAGLLASDLGLLIPQPYIVTLTPGFVASVQAAAPPYATLLQNSCPVAFGSLRLSGGYKTMSQELKPSQQTLAQMAEIAAFDAIIQNPDRRPENPNCLQKGGKLAIFDHDMAFSHLRAQFLLGFRQPWQRDSLGNFLSPQQYLFGMALRNVNPDLVRFSNAWGKVTDRRLKDYLGHLPPQWLEPEQQAFATKVLDYIKQARDHLDECLAEVKRAIRGR